MEPFFYCKLADSAYNSVILPERGLDMCYLPTLEVASTALVVPLVVYKSLRITTPNTR
jgi:hypothetical protein